jgi:hypothetical protein
MKTTLVRLFALFILISGCSKNNASDTLAPDDFFVNAKIDGTLYKASGISVYAVNTDETYNVYAVFDTKRTMYFQIDKTKGVGTHTIADAKSFAFYRDDTDAILRSDRTGGSGEVTITEKTATVVKGTFKCVVKEGNASNAKSATFTEGTFSVKFR